MKKNKIIMAIMTGLLTFTLLSSQAQAASGRFDIHYYEETGTMSRKPTYNEATGYLSVMGYDVYGYNFLNASATYDKMKTAAGVVIHMHGNPGLQYMGGNSVLCGTNGGGCTKTISSLSNSALSKMKIAIYYGCKTGVTNTAYGDIVQLTVNKGAKTAVAWTVNTVIPEVNEWNRLFFEKAQNDTVVESYRHADYWLRANKGNVAGDRMQNNRTERGNIYTTIY